jgi:hypothetical protein
LSDARAQRKTKMLYPDHRSTPWPIEDATLRLLEPIVRRARHKTLTPYSRSIRNSKSRGTLNSTCC